MVPGGPTRVFRVRQWVHHVSPLRLALGAVAAAVQERESQPGDLAALTLALSLKACGEAGIAVKLRDSSPGQNFRKEADHCPDTRLECALWWSSWAKETADAKKPRAECVACLSVCLSVQMHRYRRQRCARMLVSGGSTQGLMGGNSAALMFWRKHGQVFWGNPWGVPLTKP